MSNKSAYCCPQLRAFVHLGRDERTTPWSLFASRSLPLWNRIGSEMFRPSSNDQGQARVKKMWDYAFARSRNWGKWAFKLSESFRDKSGAHLTKQDFLATCFHVDQRARQKKSHRRRWSFLAQDQCAPQQARCGGSARAHCVRRHHDRRG